MRVVPNLYPALDPDARTPERHANPDLFTAQPAHGFHEVIVNAPDPVCCLVDLDATWEVGADGYVSRSSNSCFHGRTLQARVMLTLAAGAVVYRRPMPVRDDHAGSSTAASHSESR